VTATIQTIAAANFRVLIAVLRAGPNDLAAFRQLQQILQIDVTSTTPQESAWRCPSHLLGQYTLRGGTKIRRSLG
jgi:hypothetical protein